MDTSPVATGSLVINTTAPSFTGEASKVHRAYIFGGYDSAPAIFKFPRCQGDPVSANGFVWEIITPAASTSANITYSTDFEYISRPEIIIPVSTEASSDAGKDERACGISSMDALTATYKANQATACKMLCGGYARTGFGTLANGAYEDEPTLVLPSADPGTIKPGDLICEVVNKTLGSASPSVVTLTAADDCQVVRFMEFVIPVSKGTTDNSIGCVINADMKTAVLTGGNSTEDVVACLVMGYGA